MLIVAQYLLTISLLIKFSYDKFIKKGGEYN